MSEEKYRKIVVILLAIFVVGSLYIGSRMAENGRYVQFDQQKDHFVLGTNADDYPTKLIDTRTGVVLDVKDHAGQ